LKIKRRLTIFFKKYFPNEYFGLNGRTQRMRIEQVYKDCFLAITFTHGFGNR